MTGQEPCGVDSLWLAVVPVPADDAEFAVQVYVNGVELTAAGAGLGMDPYDVLIPTNRLVATAEPHTTPIARCDCGVYGCGATDITITRDGDLVRWDWLIEKPMNRSVCFAAEQYDAEIARAAADHSWESPVRTAGRLIMTNVDRAWLARHGLAISWAAKNYYQPELFRVALQIDSRYQVFVDMPWQDRSPEDLAEDICATLALPPQEWHARWSRISRTLTEPPAIAGEFWQGA